MALERAFSEVRFTKGVDEGKHKHALIPAELAQLENGEFEESGAIVKRPGYEALSKTVFSYFRDTDDEDPSPSGITAGEALAKNGDELLLFAHDYMWSRCEDQDDWANKGLAASIPCRSKRVSARPERQEYIDSCEVNSLEVMAWVDATSSTKAVKYTITDTDTGAHVISGAIAAVLSSPTVLGFRVVAAGNYACILWNNDSTSISGIPIDTSALLADPTPSGSTVTIVSDVLGGCPFFDVVPFSSTEFAIAYFVNGTPNDGAIIRKVTASTLAVAATAQLDTPKDATAGYDEPIALYYDPTFGRFTCAWADDGKIYASRYNSNFAVSDYRSAVVDASAVPHNIVVGPGSVFGGSTPYDVVLYDIDGATYAQERELRCKVVDPSANIYTNVQSIYNAALVTKAVKVGNNTYFVIANDSRYTGDNTDDVPLQHEADTDTLTSVYALMRLGPFTTTDGSLYPELVGLWRPGLCAGNASPTDALGDEPSRQIHTSHIATLNSIQGTNEFFFAGALKVNIRTGTYRIGTDTLRVGVDGAIHAFTNATRFSFDLANFDQRYEHEGRGRELLMGGGTLMHYDKDQVYPLGWAWPPLILNTDGVSAGVATSNTEYKAVFEWEDALGNVHQSAPSPSHFAGVIGGTGTEWDFTITTYSWGPKPTRVVLYQLMPDGIYHRVGDVETDFGRIEGIGDRTIGATVVLRLSVNDDTSLIGQTLYTTANVLTNDPVPSCIDVTVHNNRVWMVSAEKRNEVFLSKELYDGEGVSFNAGLRIELGSEEDPLVAIASMDDYLVVWSERNIYTIDGQPPDDIGQGSTLRTRRIAAEDGCVSPHSVVVTQLGCFFQSRRGIMLLDRSLKTSYVGEPVSEGLGSTLISGATIVPHRNQVRFTYPNFANTMSCLVYDYISTNWSHFFVSGSQRAVPGPSSAYWLDKHCMLNQAGTVHKQTESTYDDESNSYELRVDTGWVHFKEIARYGRLRKVLVVGESMESHAFNVVASYDLDPHADTQTKFWSDDDVDSLFSFYHPDGNRLVVEFRPNRPKSMAIRLVFSDPDTHPNTSAAMRTGQGFRLSGLLLEVGLKPEGGRIVPNLGDPDVQFGGG